MRVPLQNPKPDVESFKQVILKEKNPERVHFIELHIDKEIMRYLVENCLNERWVEPTDRESKERCLKNYIELYWRLGYDSIRLSSQFRFSSSLNFPSQLRKGKDTAYLSRGIRDWVEEGRGVITSWDDFERYPWPSAEELDLWSYEFISENIPDGMGIFASFSPGIFEILSNQLFGYQTLSLLLYDDPELVKTVASRVGELIYRCYEKIIGLPNLIGFFQGDDMGFKTSTLIAPSHLRKYILPWHKKLAALAHKNGLLYILHSCGYLEPIMEELIEEVKINAKHSFEDEIMPVGEFKRRYGNRIGVLGGV